LDFIVCNDLFYYLISFIAQLKERSIKNGVSDLLHKLRT